MKKLILALMIVFLFPLVVKAQTTTTSAPTVGDKPILFVREGCPHCAKVDAFLTKYNIKDSVIRKETFENDTNLKEMEAWFVKLKVTDPNEKGVPFLVVDDKTYYVGDVPIIEYLAKKNNITVDVAQYQSSTSDTVFLIIGGILLFGVLGYGVYSSFKKKN